MSEHGWMWVWLVAKIALVLLFLYLLVSLVSAVRGQELQHPPPSMVDPFPSWMHPNGVPCCNGRDCVAADPCELPGGGQGWLERGRCWPLPPDRQVPAPAPVWQYEPHKAVRVCRYPVYSRGILVGMNVYCWDEATGS